MRRRPGHSSPSQCVATGDARRVPLPNLSGETPPSVDDELPDPADVAVPNLPARREHRSPGRFRRPAVQLPSARASLIRRSIDSIRPSSACLEIEVQREQGVKNSESFCIKSSEKNARPRFLFRASSYLCFLLIFVFRFWFCRREFCLWRAPPLHPPSRSLPRPFSPLGGRRAGVRPLRRSSYQLLQIVPIIRTTVMQEQTL